MQSDADGFVCVDPDLKMIRNADRVAIALAKLTAHDRKADELYRLWL